MQPNICIPAVLVGTYDLNSDTQLSVTSTVAGGHRGQRNAKLAGFIFSHTFQLLRMKFYVTVKEFELNILILL